MPKISIVMPCLNVAKYLDECLQSVMGQTLTDIEIIFVDAGSTDGTLDIIEKYKKRDSRVKLIKSDMRSYGHQMNLGIADARGEYIGIVETDDYIEPDMMETLYGAISGTDAEYCKGTGEAVFMRPDKHIVLYDVVPCGKLREQKRVDISPENNPELFVSDNFLWNGIYRSDFLKTIKFNETHGAAFQDVGALFRIISQSKHGIYLDKLMYHYRQDNSGASSYNVRGLDFVRHEYEALQDYVATAKPEWRNIYFYKMAGHTVDRFRYMAFGDFWGCSHESCAWLRERLNDAFANGELKESDSDESLLMELKLFLKDDYALYDYRKELYNRHLGEFKKFVNGLDNRNLVIFGSGAWGKSICLLLDCYGISVCGFCDNDKDKQGKMCGKLKIYSLDEAMNKFENPYFLVANKNHANEIAEQLNKAGVKSDNIKVVGRQILGDSFVARMLLADKK